MGNLICILSIIKTIPQQLINIQYFNHEKYYTSFCCSFCYAFGLQKSSGSGTTTNSTYYIKCSINGVATIFNNPTVTGFAFINDTVVAGGALKYAEIQGATSVLPVETINITIDNLDTSNIVGSTFVQVLEDGLTLPAYPIECLSVQYISGKPVQFLSNTSDSVSATNPIQITFTSFTKTVIHGTFNGDIFNYTTPGSPGETITNGEFNLPVVYQ
jgi:hypothetical protein